MKPQSSKNLSTQPGKPQSSSVASAQSQSAADVSFPNDPFMIAAILGSFTQERNPIRAIVNDVTHRIQVIANLGKNRQAAELRISQLQAQVNRMESAIASATEQPAGQRFNRLR